MLRGVAADAAAHSPCGGSCALSCGLTLVGETTIDRRAIFIGAEA